MTRTGTQYIDGIRDGRSVYIDGQRVEDVTEHPAFRGAIRSLADVYDFVHGSTPEQGLTFTSPTSGEPVSMSYLIPRSEDDLTARRKALRQITERTFGIMGRGPEHVAAFLAGWTSRKDIFGRTDPRLAENVEAFYTHVRDNDLYCAYAIVPPQIDRSKPAHQQEDPFLYAGVKEEREDGIVIAGAQMLGTGAAIADFVILSNIVPLMAGDEAYAISVAVPISAPGVRVHSRRGYAAAASSVFDYPLATRFDETDSLLVFDDVFVPWDRVFVYRDLATVSEQWSKTPAHLLGNNQAQIRLATKLDLLCGVAASIAEMNGSDKVPAVRVMLGELAAHAALVWGLVVAQEKNCEIDEFGIAWPGRVECFANMTLASEFYPKLITMVRDLCGGGAIQLPSSNADFASPEIRRDLDRFVQSPGVPALERVKLMKFAWDLVGSEFASRHLQYEMFYAGAPFLVRTRMAATYNFPHARDMLARAMSGYDLEGRIGAGS